MPARTSPWFGFYEPQRIQGTRSLFQDIRRNDVRSLSAQQVLLCRYIISYTTYQKRIVTESLLTIMGKSSCISAMHRYIKCAEEHPGKTLLEHLRSDSYLILNRMKKYGADRREYDMLGEIFIALLKREVVPLAYFWQRKVDVQFWVDIPLRVDGGGWQVKEVSERSGSTQRVVEDLELPNGPEVGIHEEVNEGSLEEGDESQEDGRKEEDDLGLKMNPTLTRPLL